MAFTMACPNFKKGLKMVHGPLGVKHELVKNYKRCIMMDTLLIVVQKNTHKD
jgi:hypothetical protein